MSRIFHDLWWRISVAGLMVACGCAVHSLHAQVPARDHIFLPPTRGATAASTYIDAQARLIAATGDYLEASAIARRHHAAAAEQEIRNSVEWVRAYFERKELNRAYRQKQHPNFLQRYEKSQEQRARLIETQPQLYMAGDVTDELNWMLDKLSTHAMAYQVVFGERSDGVGETSLTPEDVQHLMLTDGSGKGANFVTYRAEGGTPLEFDWPLAFREPAFDAARDQFERARTQLLEEAGDGVVQPDAWHAVQAALDQLSSELQQQYPISRLRRDPQEFLVYNAARRFLKAKASVVFQARLSADSNYLTNEYVFKGDSVLELLQHMTHHGLRFAPPENGGEATYRRLFLDDAALVPSLLRVGS